MRIHDSSVMTALEEDMKDLHLSLDCDDSPVKSPTSSYPRIEDDVSDTVYLSRRSLKDVPDYVLRCTKLKNLYLEGNELSSLPNNLFTTLPSLVWLDLRNNQLSCLPVGIGQHRCLRTLLLEGNPITELPVELGNMLTLRALSLRNCPITFPQQDVLHQGLMHILQFLRQQAVARRPLSVCSILSASDVPSVERLPLAEVLQSSVDLCEEPNDSEVRRFQELKQRMIQMERADLGSLTPATQSPCYARPAGGDRSHRTCSLPPTRRTQGMFPELPPSDVQRWKRSEERRLAVKKELKEKQALLEQRRKDEELLREWRNQARIMQERKILEHKQLGGERDQRNEHVKALRKITSPCSSSQLRLSKYQEVTRLARKDPLHPQRAESVLLQQSETPKETFTVQPDMKNLSPGADSARNVGDSGEALYDTPCSAGLGASYGSLRKETQEARTLRDQELEQRIRTHIQMMQQRRRAPPGPPRDEVQAAALELEEVKKLQLDLEERRRERDLEYRFTAFTGDSYPRFYSK